jgi:hypothetical protein
MNKRADFVMPSWLGKMIIALIAFGLIAVLILVVVGPPAEQVVGSDIIYRLQTLSFGDRGVTGAIGDPAKAVCFGTGTSKSVICLDKGNGNEIFNAKLLIKSGYAMSKPALVSDGIILGFGKFVCKYDQTGSEQWCQTFTDPITSGIAVDDASDANVTCFETGKFPDVDGQMTCLDAKTGEFKFSVSSTEKMTSTPSIDQSKNAVYFAAGAYVYKYKLDNQGILEPPKGQTWVTKKYDHAIVSDIVLGKGLVCFDSSPKMHCVTESTGADYFNVTVDTSAKKTRDDFVAVENQTDFNLTQWEIDESSINVDIFHSLGSAGYSEKSFNCKGGMHASCTFDPYAKVVTLSDKASAGDLVNISYTFGGHLGCSSDDSQRAVSTPTIYGDSMYLDLCSSLCKYNITKSTGSKENCKDSTWDATGTFSKPLYSGVTVGIVPPISDRTLGNTLMVCTGSGQDQEIACFFDYADGPALFITIEGDWGDCPKVAADKLRYTKDWTLTPTKYFNVAFGDSTCFADSTPALSKDSLYYALGNRVCATNLTSLTTTGNLVLDGKTSKADGGIAKWCKSEGSSDLLVTGSYTWVPSVTDLAIYEPKLKFVAGTPGVIE